MSSRGCPSPSEYCFNLKLFSTAPTFDHVAVYSGVSKDSSSDFSALIPCGGTEEETSTTLLAAVPAGAGTGGGTGAAGASAFVGGSAGGAGTNSARKAYSTAKDRTKARMTRFSIRNGNSLCQRVEAPAMQGMATEQPRKGTYKAPE